MIETGVEPTLDQMRAAFDPKKHGGGVQRALKRLPMATRKSVLWVPERAEIIFIQYYPAPGAKSEPGYLLTHQPKSFDWRERHARPHPWGTGYTKLLAAALKRFDAAFGVCEH